MARITLFFFQLGKNKIALAFGILLAVVFTILTIFSDYWVLMLVLFSAGIFLTTLLVKPFQAEQKQLPKRTKKGKERRDKTPLLYMCIFIFALGFVTSLSHVILDSRSGIVNVFPDQNMFHYEETSQVYSNETTTYNFPNTEVTENVFYVDIREMDLDVTNPEIKMSFNIYVDLPLKQGDYGYVDWFINSRPYFYEKDYLAVNKGRVTLSNAKPDKNITVDYINYEMRGCNNTYSVMDWTNHEVNTHDPDYLMFIVVLHTNSSEPISPIADTMYRSLIEISIVFEYNEAPYPTENYSYGEATKVVPLGDGVQPVWYLVGVMILTVWLITFILAMITRRQYIMSSMLILLVMVAILGLFAMISMELDSGYVRGLSWLLGDIIKFVAVLIAIAKWFISIGMYVLAVTIATMLIEKAQMNFN